MKYESTILKRLIDTYGVVGNPRYISEIIKEFIVRGKERFPELFTYQADWLAHIDEFGLNPSYTVSYTGQSIYAPNTLERPVKRAILSGQTLVNLLDRNSMTPSGVNYTFDNGVYTINTTKTWSKMIFTPDLVKNKKYLVMLSTSITDVIIYYRDSHNEATRICSGGECPFIFTNPIDNLVNVTIEFPSIVTNGTVSQPMIIEYQDGMENWDIPYFDGMQSVKMPVLQTTGKNLFDVNLVPTSRTVDGWTLERTGNLIHFTSDGTKSYQQYVLDITDHLSNKIKLGVPYYFNSVINKNIANDADSICQLMITNKDGSSHFYQAPRAFTLNKEFSKIHFRIIAHNKNETGIPSDFTVQDVQLEQDSTPTSYEPYKSNILTVNEEVELRGIGNVKDELNVVTSELTQCVGEATFKGALNEGWGQFDNSAIQEQTCLFAYYGGLPSFPSENLQMICDKFTISKDGYSALLNTDKETIHVYADKAVYFRVLKSKLSTQDVDGFKKWLSQNPFTIQYQLKTESIKTVDLTILDQNGQNVKQLMSFKGGTHFNTRSSEGSTQPSVSVSVETDLEETLKMCSLDGNTM